MFRGDFTSNPKLTEEENNHHHTLLPLHNFTRKIRPKQDPLKPVAMLSTGKRTAGEPAEEDMDRFKPLHNFDLPWLKWGNQKLLRCMKVDSNGGVLVVDRNQPSETASPGGGVKRRHLEVDKRFRSSYEDDRKTESYRKFSSSEKLPVRIGIVGVGCKSSESSGGGGVSGGAKRRNSEFEKRFRSSYDDDRKIESYRIFSSSEKVPARNGIVGDGEIEATREKLMFDFQNEVVKMKDAILRERLVDPPPPPPSYIPPAERPWNLRTRRAACKAPRSPTNGVGSCREVLKPNSSPAVHECKFPKLRPACGGANASTSGEKSERPKFSVSLSRGEVEEDFTAMAGRRLPRKSKKRPRVVQKQLDTLFPGLWLSEITADLYRVPDEAETGKQKLH